MATLSENIATIKDATNIIREKVGMPTEDIMDVAEAVNTGGESFLDKFYIGDTMPDPAEYDYWIPVENNSYPIEFEPACGVTESFEGFEEDSNYTISMSQFNNTTGQFNMYSLDMYTYPMATRDFYLESNKKSKTGYFSAEDLIFYPKAFSFQEGDINLSPVYVGDSIYVMIPKSCFSDLGKDPKFWRCFSNNLLNNNKVYVAYQTGTGTAKLMEFDLGERISQGNRTISSGTVLGTFTFEQTFNTICYAREGVFYYDEYKNSSTSGRYIHKLYKLESKNGALVKTEMSTQENTIANEYRLGITFDSTHVHWGNGYNSQGVGFIIDTSTDIMFGMMASNNIRAGAINLLAELGYDWLNISQYHSLVLPQGYFFIELIGDYESAGGMIFKYNPSTKEAELVFLGLPSESSSECYLYRCYDGNFWFANYNTISKNLHMYFAEGMFVTTPNGEKSFYNTDLIHKDILVDFSTNEPIQILPGLIMGSTTSIDTDSRIVIPSNNNSSDEWERSPYLFKLYLDDTQTTYTTIAVDEQYNLVCYSDGLEYPFNYSNGEDWYNAVEDWDRLIDNGRMW